MKQKIKPLLFIKIVTFIILSWIYQFDVYLSMHNKSLNECYNHRRKIYTTNYRLLAKYKQDRDLSFFCLKEESPNGVNYKEDISSNEEGEVGKKKHINGSLSTNARRNKKSLNNKSCIFETKKYSHLEKKIFKELDYVDFLKNSRTISDKIYKKILLKKCGLRIALPLLLFLVLAVSFILDHFCGCGLSRGLFKLIILLSPSVTVSTLTRNPLFSHIDNITNVFEKSEISSAFAYLYAFLTKPSLNPFTKALVETSNAGVRKVRNYCVSGFLGFLIYFVPIFILSIILISGLIYYHKKVKKYEKIKYMKR
ncbi:fam-l protein [Plasmodium malariae]|uniref:Fam-l protein n=1 Tax=Plasmodium malariae TaxID=5858 RepID=A0A1D3PBH8_PLAMA|nr:fam-l protein [Plasmodium malariae]SCN12479.1 fam-l protein [Plasmodium malariae]